MVVGVDCCKLFTSDWRTFEKGDAEAEAARLIGMWWILAEGGMVSLLARSNA